MLEQAPASCVIWGCGLVGYTLARVLAARGTTCHVVDLDEDVVERVRRGEYPREYFAHLLPAPTRSDSEHIVAHRDGGGALAAGAQLHFIAVPTETGDHPSAAALRDVLRAITAQPPPFAPLYVICESTLAPNWVSEIVHAAFRSAGWEHRTHYHFGIAPRRDVFYDTALTMQHIARVVGGDSPEMVAMLRQVYEPISGALHEARDAAHAAMTKVVENYLRDLALAAVNRLAGSFDQYDMRHVFELASTKWNVDSYYPSLGIGGYCVPLARHYLAAAATGAHAEWLLHTYAEDARYLFDQLAALLATRAVGTAAVLGLSYAPLIKVHKRAPAFRVIEFLQSSGWRVAVHDPLYDEAEIQVETGCPALSLPRDLAGADLVVLLTKHPEYAGNAGHALRASLRPGALVVDSCGAWPDSQLPDHIEYWAVGQGVSRSATGSELMTRSWDISPAGVSPDPIGAVQ
jgi:nucleotide sugar dehydrogenase